MSSRQKLTGEEELKLADGWKAKLVIWSRTGMQLSKEFCNRPAVTLT